MRRTGALLLTATSVLLAGCGSSQTSTHHVAKTVASKPTATATTQGVSTQGPELSAENVPLQTGALIGSAGTTGTGTIDGVIKCLPSEQTVYHIHAHLSVYVDGAQRALPAGIGIPGAEAESVPGHGAFVVAGQCFYFLHTHAQDGIIHIESPNSRIYTLGEFFDEWHQPLSRTQIGTIRGTSTWVVNGRVWTKNVRDIPLLSHEDIQADIGQPSVPYKPIDWKITGL